MRNKNSLIAFIKKTKLKQAIQLINSKTGINEIDEEGYSALHWSIINGQSEIVKLLVEKGADIKLRTGKGLSPMELAIYARRENIVRILFSYYKDKERSLVLHTAAALNDFKILKELINMGAKVNARDNFARTPLHWAAQEGSLTAAKILLENGAHIDAADSEKFSPLTIATGEGHFHFIKFLLSQGANVNRNIGRLGTALHFACAYNHIKIAKLLINSDARVNVRDSNGQTPLHFASMNCNKELIELLIESKAKTNIKDNDGKIPLELAKNCDMKIQKMLLR